LNCFSVPRSDVELRGVIEALTFAACAGPTEVQLGIFINYFFELSEQTMVSYNLSLATYMLIITALQTQSKSICLALSHLFVVNEILGGQFHCLVDLFFLVCNVCRACLIKEYETQ